MAWLMLRRFAIGGLPAEGYFPLRLPVAQCPALGSVSGAQEACAEDAFAADGGDVVPGGLSGDDNSRGADEVAFKGKPKYEVCVRCLPGHAAHEFVFCEALAECSPLKQGVEGFFKFCFLLGCLALKGGKLFFNLLKPTAKAMGGEGVCWKHLARIKTADSVEGAAKFVSDGSECGRDVAAEDDTECGESGNGSPLNDAVDDGAPVSGCEKVVDDLHVGSVSVSGWIYKTNMVMSVNK